MSRADKYARPFQFRKFSVYQQHAAMKVGTDGVLIGALAGNGNYQHILDIGTGTGLIALMLAQRFQHATISAIEIDEKAVLDAEKSFSESPYSDRIALIHSPFQEYAGEHSFDLIVSNPPFYENALRSGISERDLARHSNDLSFEELLEHSNRLSSAKAELYIILPFQTADRFIAMARMRNWFLFYRMNVSSWKNEQAVRVVLGFHHAIDSEVIMNEMYLYDAPNVRSAEYESITSEFYL